MIETTVIGSYPVQINREKIMNNYFDQKAYSWNQYITKSVEDMVNAGIDIISDGQTRDPFVNIFARKLKGCRIRDRIEVVDNIEYINQITVEDLKYVKSIIPSKTKLVGLIAGPYTLAKSSVDLFYNDMKEMSFDYAKALRNEAEAIEKYVDLISIDEPFYSVEFPDYAKDLIKIITKNIAVPKRLHVCGNVSKIFKDLIEIPVDILSHEFMATPSLLNEFKDYTFSQNICLGSVRSDDVKVESVDEITKHIKNALDIFGDKIIQISPDCGLRLLPGDVAFNKLKNLVSAGRIINA